MKAIQEDHQYPLPMGFPLEDTNEPNERRLVQEVITKSYEEYDDVGERRIRVETTKRVWFDTQDALHNPTKSYTVEYL